MDDNILRLPAGAIPAGTKKTVTLSLTAYEAERLDNLTRLYDAAMVAPAPALFVETITWAHQRHAAQAEIARFLRELLRKADQ